MRYNQQIKIGNIATSEAEIRDIIKAWAAISIAFGIIIGGVSLSGRFYIAFIISSITVGLGFLLHELGHKIVAQKYGCFAEFRSFDMMLVFAVLLAVLTQGRFVFAAPGAVMISGPVGVRRNGKISIAGPLVNIALALIFLGLFLASGSGFLGTAAFYGYMVNSWLALFNMIPFWNFDGAKILKWSRINYAAVVAVSFALMMAQNFIRIR